MIGLVTLIYFAVCAFEANSQSPVFSWQPDSLILAHDDTSSLSVFDVSNKNADITSHRELSHGSNFSEAIAYDSTTATLFWSGYEKSPEADSWTSHIFSTVNNSGVVNTLHNDSASVHGLAVDSRRELLFFTLGWDQDSVGVMSTSGQNLRNLGSVHSKCFMSPFELTLDTERRIIYVACYYRLISMTYDGASIQELDSGGKIYSVFLHESTGTLYFNNYRELHTMNPSDSSRYQDFYKYLPGASTSVKRYGNYLFIAYQESDYIDVVDLENSRTHKIRNFPSDKYHRLTLAYVPRFDVSSVLRRMFYCLHHTCTEFP